MRKSVLCLAAILCLTLALPITFGSDDAIAGDDDGNAIRVAEAGKRKHRKRKRNRKRARKNKNKNKQAPTTASFAAASEDTEATPDQTDTAEAGPRPVEVAAVTPKEERPARRRKKASSSGSTEAVSKRVMPKSKSRYVLGTSLDLFTEFSTLSGRQRIDVAEFDQSFGYKAGPVALRLWGWIPFKKRFRVGAGGTYRPYSVSSSDGDFNFGSLVETYAQIDFDLPNYKRVDFSVEARAGLSVLVPGGDLSREMDQLEADGVDVFPGPRLGWQTGLGFSTRYPFTERFGVVGTLAFDIGRIYLFRTKQTVDNFNLDRSWTNQVQRLTFSIGVEMGL